jgi:uncharacterized protein
VKGFNRIFFLLIFSQGVLKAQPPIPDPAGRWVIDDAHVLSESTEHTITTLCRKEFDSTSNQVVVYTFSSLQGGTIESYANEVYNKWQIGSKENNNGILLIIAVDDHKMRIEVGYGLEPYLTDLEAKDIIDNEIKPNFKEGDFDNGVIKGVQNIIYGIRNSYVAPYKAGNNGSTGLQSTDNFRLGPVYFILFAVWLGLSLLASRMKIGEGIFTMIFFAIFILIFVFLVYGFFYGGILGISGFIFMVVMHLLWKPKKFVKFWSAGGSVGGTWTSSGSNWNNDSYDSGSSWSSGGGGGDGGSSFSGGGGSSGGGGASGDW